MDIQRSILIVALAVVSYLLVLQWNKDYGQPELPAASASMNTTQGLPDTPSASGTSSDVPTAQSSAAGSEAADKPVAVSDKLIQVKTDVLDLAIDPRGGDIVQDTDGSRSMRHWFEPMRRCGAAARQMLEQAAANQWKVPLGECRAEQNKVLHAPSGRSLSFGELAEAAAGLEVPARDKLLLKKPEQFRYIGKDVARAIDGADIVNGRAGFGFDARFDDMLYAVVARPPVYGGKL